MVEHRRQLVVHELPVRPADQAWILRPQQYREWLDEGTGLLFIAQLSACAMPIGYAFCRLMTSGPTFDLGSVRAEIDSLVVADAARGGGVGTALVAACREELRRRDIHYWSIGVVEENRDAIQLHERLGFRPWTRTMLGRVRVTAPQPRAGVVPRDRTEPRRDRRAARRGIPRRATAPRAAAPAPARAQIQADVRARREQ